MTMPKKTRPFRERQTAAGIIMHEHYQFHAALDLLRAAEALPGDLTDLVNTDALRKAALESALLHARNLRDFFRGGANPEDIGARDFIVNVPPFRMAFLESRDFEEMLHKVLSHPTFKRGKVAGSWPLNRIEKDLSDAWGAFIAAVEREGVYSVNFFLEAGRQD